MYISAYIILEIGCQAYFLDVFGNKTLVGQTLSFFGWNAWVFLKYFEGFFVIPSVRCKFPDFSRPVLLLVVICVLDIKQNLAWY